MSTDAVTLFFALLAVVVQLAVVATLVALVAGGANVRSRLVDTIGPDATKLALAIATTATLGSLYLSEVANFIPCRLCWIQRGFMYPLVPLLALAEWRRIAILQRLGLLLAGVGAGVSIYHVLLERLPQLETDICAVENPCTLIWINRFGYLTIPTMALSGFAGIITLLSLRWWYERRSGTFVTSERSEEPAHTAS